MRRGIEKRDECRRGVRSVWQGAGRHGATQRSVRRPTGDARGARGIQCLDGRYAGRCRALDIQHGRRHGRMPCRRAASEACGAGDREDAGCTESCRASVATCCTRGRWRASVRRRAARHCHPPSGAASCRVFHGPSGSGPSLGPPFCSHIRRIERRSRPVDPIGFSKLVEQNPVQSLPHARCLPIA